MRKLAALIIVLAISITVSSPAQAANKTSTLTFALQKYLSDGEVNYRKTLADAKALFEPQIRTAQTKIITAQSQLSQANQVTILKTTTHASSGTIGIDAVNCPATRTDCKDSVYKSNEFKAGEVSTIYALVGGDDAFSNGSWAQMNLGILQIIDLEVKDGLISLNNASSYNDAVATIRLQYQNRLTLVQQYSSVQSAAETVREKIQSAKSTIDAGIISAKRAGMNSNIFENAFIASFKFEYNAQRLNQLARSPWTYITSLKALNDAVSVTKSSMQADAVSAKYSYAAAVKINNIYGNLFTQEEDFKNGFKLIADIYKSSIGVQLKLNK